MKTQNYAQLIGYLRSDPITRKTANGGKMTLLQVATDHYRMDNSGNFIRKVTWHDISAWGQLAEKVEGKFMKGSHVLVQGEIDYQTYPDLHGHTRYVTEIIASSITDLDR